MAIQQHNHQLQHNENVSSVLDALYCDEAKWEEEDEDSDVTTNNDACGVHVHHSAGASLFPLLLLEQDLFWEDEELSSLFSKEKLQHEQVYGCNNLNSDSNDNNNHVHLNPSFSQPRREAVEWMLKVNAHYGFSALTATLAVTYLDRFLLSFHFQREKPWMIQLVAVTCISLAAKVEETQVPLLLDLQVGSSSQSFVHLSAFFLLFILGRCLITRVCLYVFRCKTLSMCLRQRLFREWSCWCCPPSNGRCIP